MEISAGGKVKRSMKRDLRKRVSELSRDVDVGKRITATITSGTEHPDKEVFANSPPTENP